LRLRPNRGLSRFAPIFRPLNPPVAEFFLFPSEMLDFTPPPGVLANATGVSITVNNAPVTTTYFLFTLSSAWGSAASASLRYEIWVDAQRFTRRIKVSTFVSDFTIEYQMDLWNVANLTTAAVLTPLQCANKCKSASVISATAPTAYPSAGVACTSSGSQCICQTTLSQSNAFCGSVVNYAIKADLYVSITNNQAEASFTAAITVTSGLSQACKDSLKEYFCRFYLPWCSSDAEKKPLLPTCLSQEDKTSLYQSGDSAFASYSAIDGTTSGKSATTPSASGASQMIASASSGLIAVFLTLLAYFM
jgi:hypothetical protein